MNEKDLIRQAMILTVLGFTSLMAHYSSHTFDPARTLVPTIRLGSYTTLAIAVLLAIRSAVYKMPTVKHLPSLSVKSIVVYVYGLGLLVYVTTYCLLDTGVCKYFHLAALAGVSLDDFAERWGQARLRKTLLALATLSATMVFCFKGALSPDGGESIEALVSGKYYVFIFGFVLPALVPIAYLAIRSRRFYNPVTVMEFMHLSMPFSVHASLSTLLSLSLISYDYGTENETPEVTMWSSMDSKLNSTSIFLPDQPRLVTTADVTTPILALCMFPCVFLAIQCTLLYSVADFLAPAALVTAVRHASEASADRIAWPDVALVVAGVAAFGLRLYTCFQDQDDHSGVLYTSEEDYDRRAGRQEELTEHAKNPETLKILQHVALMDIDECEV